MSPTYSTATIQAPATLLDFLLVPSKMHSLLARLGSPDVWQRQFLVSLVTETKKKGPHFWASISFPAPLIYYGCWQEMAV
ncbi:Protein CBG27506 [Caenorhabditis briggsae]|uniref:Protein CBG27506 n=1 Tax=Caenorhabditis briggsae TaxID=6238 RepID=B6IF21_CAEBR|nr:Protein CBG27506 [Caenorhabditis briggsae]CAR98501.1 Protein CBG27506 [Caenorhabditis briggsae]